MGMNPRQAMALQLSDDGLTRKQISTEMGLSESAIKGLLSRARRWERADPEIANAATAAGLQDPAHLKHYWKIAKDEDGNGYSVFIRNPDAPDEVLSFRDLIAETLNELTFDLKLPKRFEAQDGNLLVLDPADVHIGKLCIASETGYTYNEEIAAHRLIEGSRLLLERGLEEGVSRVAFIMGNDKAHIDTPRGTTTSGTPQDASTSLFEIYRVAQRADIAVINMALEMGLEVHPIHVSSNHDWVLGWTIAQAVGAMFSGHPNVHVNDYYLSERHRKYFRFANNLIAWTHADGAKEKDLTALMLKEAPQHVGECDFRYWYLHHLHHKITRRQGIIEMTREKDHIAMTAIHTGPGKELSDTAIEYVRSTSPPDGWHDRNGYVNRQAVEAFIHHPHEGQKTRLTEYF